jgi:hypothetical protein
MDCPRRRRQLQGASKQSSVPGPLKARVLRDVDEVEDSCGRHSSGLTRKSSKTGCGGGRSQNDTENRQTFATRRRARVSLTCQTRTTLTPSSTQAATGLPTDHGGTGSSWPRLSTSPHWFACRWTSKMSSTTVPLVFYTDRRGSELAPSQLQKGYTIEILYAQRHAFKFSEPGIRHRSPRISGQLQLPSRQQTWLRF